MFAIDTNLLIYAHNIASEFHIEAKSFLEKVMNERDEKGKLSVCVPVQVLLEFIHVITWQRLQSPLSLSQARQIVEDYVETGVTIVHQRETQLRTFLDLLGMTTTRKKVFDVALAATLKDNGIVGLYTANVADFEDFDFLKVVNPL